MKLEVFLNVWLTNKYCMKHVHDLWYRHSVTHNFYYVYEDFLAV